jgi:hypothetical protein
MKNLFFILFSLCVFSIHAEEITVPQNAAKDVSLDDEEIKSLVWNRFVNKNFTILSIDEKKGYWLYKNIDQINDWVSLRWGFPKVDFSKECRIFCVPNKSLLKKLFGLEESKVEVRRKDGEIEISVIWLVLEETNFSQVAPYLTRASLADFENQGINIPWWFTRSAEILNSPLEKIKSFLKEPIQDSKNLSCEKVFDTTFEDYSKLTIDEKNLFDQRCLILCLMLRKELGEIKLQSLLALESKNKIEKVLNFVYGYSGIQEFEKKFSLYSKDFWNAIDSGDMPSSYFKINRSAK